MKKVFLFLLMLLYVGCVYSQKEIIQTISSGKSAMFIEYKNFSSTQEILDAIRSGKSTKIKFLYSGEQYVVLGLDRETPMLWSSYVLVERIKGSKRIKGWLSTKDIEDRTPLATSFPIGDFPVVRDEFLEKIKAQKVSIGMNKSEVFLATNIYRDAAKEINGYETWTELGTGGKLGWSSLCFYQGELCKSVGKYGNFYYQPKVSFELIGVECSEDLIEVDSTQLGNGIYEDEYSCFKWEINQKQLSFSLTNKYNSSLKIDWNEILLVDHFNVSRKIIHKGVKLKDREAYQTPSAVAKKSWINDIIIPSDNIEYDKDVLKDWILRDLVSIYSVGESPNDESYKNAIGRSIRVIFPLFFREKQIEYVFIFRINDIDFELVSGDYRVRDRY